MLLKVCFFAVAVVISYLIGSISFAVIISKLMKNRDVREYGSGNAGMTNMLRNFGALSGIFTFVGDFLKAAASVCLGMYAVNPMISHYCGSAPDKICIGFLCAAACVLGHSFPLYFGFRGGKGIVAAFGSILFIDWRAGVILAAVFAAVFLLSRIVSLCSVISAAAFPVITAVLSAADGSTAGMFAYKTVSAAVLAGIVIFMHRSNIRRILRGEEKKITVKKTEKR